MVANRPGGPEGPPLPDDGSTPTGVPTADNTGRPYAVFILAAVLAVVVLGGLVWLIVASR